MATHIFPRNVVSVAERLRVSIAWIAEQLNINQLPPTAVLTKEAVLYLEWVADSSGLSAVAFPNQIFEEEVITKPAPRKRASMYARQIKLGDQSHLTPTILPTKALQCRNKEGQWQDRDMFVCTHDGVLYYFQEMRVNNYGIILYHVWGIFAS